jgi:single-stranded DNA-binding protein
MINDVRLVGRLVKDPEFATASNKKEFFRLVVETEKFVRINGEPRRVTTLHAVTCFNQFSLKAMRDHGKVGCVVKILGELSGVRDNRPEITVGQWSGEAAIMFPDDAVPAPAARVEETSRKADAPQTKPTGGLGRLSDTGKASPIKTGGKLKEYDALDDEIPF